MCPPAVEIVSDDGGTTMTFYPTGTYQFYFSAYDISDAGSYTYTDGVLTLTATFTQMESSESAGTVMMSATTNCSPL